MAAVFGKMMALRTARRYAGKHSEQVHGGIDKVAGAVRDRAPEQHRSKVDGAASFLKKAATGRDEDDQAREAEAREARDRRGGGRRRSRR